jgi:uncharacterized protein (DUF952 family)
LSGSGGKARTIYKICLRELWQDADRKGVFTGAPVDLTDGYIHFSAGNQVQETAAKHFSGIEDLVLVAIDAAKLGPALRWEKSRGGALFPHLHAPLDFDAVIWVKPLPLEPTGGHLFPELRE